MLYIILLGLVLLGFVAIRKVRNFRNSVRYVDSREPIPFCSPTFFWWGVLREGMGSYMVKGIHQIMQFMLDNEIEQCTTLIMNQPAVVIGDPQSINYILRHDEDFPKFISNYGISSKFIGDKNLLGVSNDQWKHDRHVLNEVFASNSMFFDPIREHVDVFLKRAIESRIGIDNSSPIGEDLTLWVLDTFVKGILGGKGDLLLGDSNAPFEAYLEIFDRGPNPLETVEIAKVFPGVRNAHKCVDIFHAYVNELLDKFEPNEENQNSILSIMTEQERKGTMTRENIVGNICLFFAAGHEATASSMHLQMFLFAKHQELQEICRQEILELVKDGYDYSTIKKMKHLDNFLNEQMRYDSASEILVFRRATKDTQLENVFIPKDSLILPVVGMSGMNPKYWDNPSEFNPSRFDSVTKTQSRSMLQFGSGPKVCIGKNFSILEQKLFWIEILSNYRVLMTEDSRVEKIKLVPTPRDELISVYFEKL